MSEKCRVADIISICRPVNSLMMGLAVVVGATIASPSYSIVVEYPIKLILGFLAGSLLTAASMVFNDIMDIEIDRINAPHKPLSSGRMSPSCAWTLFAVLTTLGLLLSLLIGIVPLAIALASLLVAVAYSVRGKKTGLPGNMMVSFTVAIPILFGGSIVGELSGRLLAFYTIIFLANTGREITKGIVDVIGDSAKNVLTLSVRYGSYKAALVALAFYASAVVLSVIPVLMNWAGTLYAALVSVVDAGILYYALVLVRDPRPQTAFLVKEKVRYLMLLGLVAFLLSRA